MHPEADALLDAIFDDPDDTPRLVYADWLQEHDQEAYAQFIRLQCAAAREAFWSDEANRLWEEIGRVWTRLDEEWWPATRDVWNLPVMKSRWNLGTGAFVNEPGTDAGLLDARHFHRGFLRESIALTAGDLIAYGNSCWPWFPPPSVTLTPDGSEQELLSTPRVSRIRALHLRNWDDHGYALWFVGSPELTNLEVLDLSDVYLVESDVDDLLRPELFPKLKEVRLRVHDSEFWVSEPEPSPRHRLCRQRAEQRFKKIVWRTG